MLDFRMKTFLTVCRCMNFTRASEELQITQPAVSQHIRFLEKHYGKKLFCYEGKRLGLTEAGEMLRNASMMMMDEELSLQNQMQGSAEEKRELRFGVTSALGDTVITEVLKQFMLADTVISEKKKEVNRGKRMHLKMDVAHTDELLRALDEGTIDFALIDGNFRRKEYEFRHYSTERLTAVCGAGYKFAEKPRKVEELLDECVLLREKGEGSRSIFTYFLDSRNLSVEDFAKVAEIGDLHTLKELTKAGCGITFLYETAVQKELECGELQEIKLKDFHVTHDFTFVWKKGSSYAEQYRDLFAKL